MGKESPIFVINQKESWKGATSQMVLLPLVLTLPLSFTQLQAISVCCQFLIWGMRRRVVFLFGWMSNTDSNVPFLSGFLMDDILKVGFRIRVSTKASHCLSWRARCLVQRLKVCNCSAQRAASLAKRSSQSEGLSALFLGSGFLNATQICSQRRGEKMS